MGSSHIQDYVQSMLLAGVHRAEQVGSLLRPEALKQHRADVDGGALSPESLRRVEDEHIEQLVNLQLEAGLLSITDGEFRRRAFHIDFATQISGVEYRQDIQTEKPRKDSPSKIFITKRLQHDKDIQVADYLFLKHAIEKAAGGRPATPKVCIPSPCMLHFRGGRENIDAEAYPDLDDFFRDVVRVWREEIQALYQAGCRMIQLDETNMTYLCDPFHRQLASDRHGNDADALLKIYSGLINAVTADRPDDLVIGMHLCRGNYRSQFFADGGYEPIAATLFGKLDVDVYFLEYDDARSGDFAPLRYLRPGKIAVLGLMTSKTPVMYEEEDVVGRLKQAASFCPEGLRQLCLSHQCGFSSSVEGNELTGQEQWAKIKQMTRIAARVWPDSE